MSCNVCSGNDVERSGSYLYHVKRTIDHLSHDPNAHMYQVHLCGTFTDLKAATKAVYSALGHPKESFSSLESKQDCPHGQKWPYRAAVYLRAPAAHSLLRGPRWLRSRDNRSGHIQIKASC
jgi:hypothetical protein